jgi:protein gp37
MAEKTSIEWTDSSWTPIRARNKATGKQGHYCQKISPGCANCYADAMNGWRGTGIPYAVDKFDQVELYLDEKALLDPLKWKKPRMIFVCSMTDLFAEFVPDEWIDWLFAVMALSPQHTFQVLTKRPRRMLGYLGQRTTSNVYRWIGGDDEPEKQFEMALRVQSQMLDLFKIAPAAALNRASELNELAPWFPLPNVWLGTSVENQKYADERIPLLLQTPAAVRFISAEPLLGPVALNYLHHDGTVEVDALNGTHGVLRPHQGINEKLDWVICGGESGPSARPMDPAWARSLRDQCAASGVAYFCKQMGSTFGPSKGHNIPPDLRIHQFPTQEPK